MNKDSGREKSLRLSLMRKKERLKKKMSLKKWCRNINYCIQGRLGSGSDQGSNVIWLQIKSLVGRDLRH